MVMIVKFNLKNLELIILYRIHRGLLFTKGIIP